MLGSVTRQNTCQPLAPRLTAASSSSGPIASITGISSRTTSGSVTNVVASTSPGQAKITFTASQASVGPRMPCRPKISTRASPATTGETEKGTSNRATSNDRPGNRNRATSHAAAMPKTVLNATATGATVSDSQMAWRVSGSCAIASHQACGPCEKASAKTLASGTTISRPIVATAPVTSSASSGVRPGLVGRVLAIKRSGRKPRRYWAFWAKRCCRRFTITSSVREIASRTTAIAVASA